MPEGAVMTFDDERWGAASRGVEPPDVVVEGVRGDTEGGRFESEDIDKKETRE